jgi:hypothetical protein
MSGPSPDFIAAAPEIVRKLLGEPPVTERGGRVWRYGTRGSLAIDIAKGTFFDHERNAGGGLLDLVAREQRTDKAGALDWLRAAGFLEDRRAEKPERRIAATYDYVDGNGELQFQVVRFQPKDFRQRRPDGNGGWIWKLDGIAPLPYRLAELLAAPAPTPVFVVEGEKDADSLRDRLLVATTSPGGAGKFPATFAGYFAGRHVIILPDNDPAGERHAQDVAAKLQGQAASIRILRLPGLPEKGDASDWLAAGGTAEELQRLAAEAPEWRPEPEPEPHTTPADAPAFLSVSAWLERQTPPADRLLGDLITTSTRTFLVGRTGLGKTNLAMGAAVGISSGAGLLHWRSDRPGRVLYIDGEMPAELIRDRLRDAIRRAGVEVPAGNLLIYARDLEDEFATRFPTLGRMPPLNSEAGMNWLLALLDAIGGVDLIIFDNVMSLIAGDQKDEIAWAETLPLVQALTSRRIGQLWLDHTGHNTERQYGSSTKAWRFDAVGIMSALEEGDRAPGELAFTLSFEHPGKARRRTPANWHDFATCTIRLAADRWTAEPTERRATKAKLSPMGEQFRRALLDALAISSTPGRTTREAWYGECVRTGLADAISPDDDYRRKDEKRRLFRKYIGELKAASIIGVDGETVTLLGAEASR